MKISRCCTLLGLGLLTMVGTVGAANETLIRHSEAATLYRETHSLMGTSVEFIIATKDFKNASRAIADALAEMARIEALMSEWQPDSVVSQINAMAGKQGVHVPKELMRLLQAGLDLGHLTHGKFDITWYAIGSLWDFRRAQRPDTTELVAALAHVDYRHLQLDAIAGTAFLANPQARIGLGGIAKGYAVDRAAQILRDTGFAKFVVNAGGDLFASGKHEEKLWRVGIQDPRNPDELTALLPVANAAVATSGDYQRFFMLDGKRYHHILDPATGQPARLCRSVTILAPRAYQADALATGVFVLGPQQGMALVERMQDVEVMIIDALGETTVSSGFE